MNRVQRLLAVRRELRATGAAKRPWGGAAPATERRSLKLTLDEHNAIKRAADDALLSVEGFMRAAALHFVARLYEGDES